MRLWGLAAVLIAAPACAAGEPAPRPLAGRYALHREACKANDIFLALKADQLDLPGFSCTGLRFVARAGGGDRAVWDVTGNRCQGEEGPPGRQHFRLEARGTSLRILWADGSTSAPLLYCGR